MKPVSQDDSVRFRDALNEQGIQAPLVHASYLINLASPDDVLWNKSIDALETELRRADALSIPYVVFHPGSYTKSDPESGLRRVAEALDEREVMMIAGKRKRSWELKVALGNPFPGRRVLRLSLGL